ncbi:MAG TPA: histidinol-phosphate transaminase [Candidatus Paceibacterota bacterium]|nr:histidinol-phosphate transaminase [Verrucomicrobiota bacterium]HOX01881.1 histidinol-phosphate transaminase [Verrucomicrobiota bacterium]HRZ44781.1 histidinol-phosphate transaminase [Candidatus Paceibacterota bacterium]HRZ92088.1 histidinol-phosphate transaminase [Candidatus Paceibacterota bacterium]
MKRIRPLVARLRAYVPGEQPQTPGWVKLNTNENPYPPSPRVLKAVRDAADGRLRLYPNPTAQPLREALARLHGCLPDRIIVGNGSDELLALAVRALVEPAAPARGPVKASARQPLSRSTVQYLSPCYSLYPVLAAIHGARVNDQPLADGFGLPSARQLRRDGRWDFQAALTFITTPNAPTGRGYRAAEIEPLVRAQRGVVVLDEAYVDFAEENAMELALRHPHVLVARTFSKAYSLCFQRVGYMVGHPDLIGALMKIKDSYNVNGLGQAAALATLDDLAYYRANFRKIKAARAWLAQELTRLGFEVWPSQTNFILARPPGRPAREWLEALRRHKILVRWFDRAVIRRFLRITVGTAAEAEALVRAAEKIVRSRRG